MLQPENGNSENTLKILIATDNHIGYMEKDVCRKNDSIRTFEEVLKIGKDNEVDFVLLGGDLFHDNKPSRTSLHGSIQLFRKYCYGDKPCPVAFMSDPVVNFGHTPFKEVNYQDPNINVAMPVFSIHGNHDDPAGPSSLCSLDLLHSAGLVNYFGKVNNLEGIKISPLLLQKGTSKLALYGLGNIRDERLHRCFVNKDVNFLRPSKDTEDWFSILVLHQNRSKHGLKNYIPEQFLDDFLDLILWGHEHECKVDISWNGVQNFYITQPGSSIATSLSEGEMKEKFVGLLYVNGKDFKIEKVKLNTVRQFYLEDISLHDTGILPSHANSSSKVESYCAEVVQKYLDQAAAERDLNPQIPNKPLIRLRVDYSHEEGTTPYDLFSVPRFSQKYIDKVANPKDMVLFHRKRAQLRKNNGGTGEGPNIDVRLEGLDSNQVEDMVKQYFKTSDKKFSLSLLTEGGISEAVKDFVWKDEKDSVNALVNYELKHTQNHLLVKDTKDVEIEDEILKMRNIMVKDEWKENYDKKDGGAKRGGGGGRDDGDLGDGEVDDIEMDVIEEVVPKGGRGRSRGRGGRGGSRGVTKSASAAKKKQKVIEDLEEIEEFDEEEEEEEEEKEVRVVKNKRVQGKSKRFMKVIDDEFDEEGEEDVRVVKNKRVQGKTKRPMKVIDDEFDEEDDVDNRSIASRSVRETQKRRIKRQVDYDDEDDGGGRQEQQHDSGGGSEDVVGSGVFFGNMVPKDKKNIGF